MKPFLEAVAPWDASASVSQQHRNKTSLRLEKMRIRLYETEIALEDPEHSYRLPGADAATKICKVRFIGRNKFRRWRCRICARGSDDERSAE